MNQKKRPLKLTVPRTPKKIKIKSLSDALKIVSGELDGKTRSFPPPTDKLQDIFCYKDFVHVNESELEGETSGVLYKFPFGIWFRGQNRQCFPPVPTLFRAHPHFRDDCGKYEQI